MNPQSRSFRLPEIRFSFPGNLKVYAVRRPELPLISINLVTPRGAEADPPGKAGLSQMAAEMLTLGTDKRSASELAAELDGMGAALTAHAEWDATLLQIFGLSEDFGRLMGLLQEIYTRPSFAPDEFEELRQRRIAALVQQKDESQIIASERFQEALFRGTAYDHPVQGTLKSVPGLTREEAKGFYQDSFLKEGSFLVLVGDVQPDDGFRWIETNFPSFRPRRDPGGGVALSSPPSGRRIILVDRPDLTQSQIRLGHIAIPHAHPDFVPCEVSNYILGGGGFSSRLMQRIRSELGYTYGIRSALEAQKNPGPFLISTFTPTETTFPCVEEIFAVMRSFLARGAMDSEREEAVNFLTGSYPMRFESLFQIAGRIIQAELHGLGLEFLSRYPEQVAAVSLEEMGRAARTHLHPEEMLIVIVGRIEKFRRELEKLGPVEIME